MRLLSALIVSGLIAVPTAAQTQVFMISHQAARPVATPTTASRTAAPTRYQQVYDAASFDVGTPTALSTLYYRMNKSYANGNYGGQTVELAVWMAFAAANVDSQTCTGTFANNLDNTSLKNVLKKTKVVMPKLSTTAWGIKLPFDSGTTFLYGAMLQKNLVVETRIYGNSNNNGVFTYPLDAYSASSNTRKNNGGSWSACKFANGNYNNSISYTTGGLNNNGGTWYVRYNNLPTNTAGIATLSGFGVNNLPHAWPLPISLAPLGSPSCDWRVGLEMGLWIPLATGSNTYAQWPNITIPAGLGGVSFFDHAVFLDTPTSTNKSGLVTTWSSEWGIAKPVTGSITRIYAYNSSTPVNPDTVASGSLGKNYGLMTQLSN
ncbi:MAG: hypothetical protein R3F30_03070 [Planctomycetota bacterium]